MLSIPNSDFNSGWHTLLKYFFYIIIFIFLFIIPLLLPGYNSFALSLEDYLQQVKKTNNSYQSNKLLNQAGVYKSKEGFLTTSPQLAADISYLSNSEPPVSQPLSGRKTQQEQYNISLAKKFTTGTSVKLEYQNNYNDISGTSPALVRHQRFWYAKPIVSLEQPLFRDWLGKETKAIINLKNSQAKAKGHMASFNNKKTILDATTTYWDLANLLANIDIKKESINRAKKLLSWAQKRSKLGLGNQSDMLQAKSSLLQKEYELQALLDMRKSKTRMFNALRNISSDKISTSLTSFNNIKLAKIRAPHSSLPPSLRDDMKAKFQNLQTLKNQATLSSQQITPTLNLKMQYYPTGWDQHYRHTAAEAWRAKHNTFAASLNYQMPLDIFLSRDLNSAYNAERHAAELDYSQSLFELNNQWKLLTEQFDLLNNQVVLSKSLLETQLEKLHNEQELLKNGRTTTFQVLQFEQDLLNAQAQYFNTKNKLLNLVASINLFYE